MTTTAVAVADGDGSDSGEVAAEEGGGHDGREQGDPLEDDLRVLEEGDGDIVLEDSVGLNFDPEVAKKPEGGE